MNYFSAAAASISALLRLSSSAGLVDSLGDSFFLLSAIERLLPVGSALSVACRSVDDFNEWLPAKSKS